VTGEAGTAASFAGRWTERYGCGAFPVQGLRLYELGELQGMGVVAGSLRAGGEGDRALAAGWMEAFYGETRMPGGNATGVIAAALAGGGLWVWENGGAVVSMAISSRPMEGVVRVSGVYTPPAERRRGYAGACVYGVSQRFAEDGYRCVLYTDLGNPTSNSIYRGMGYRLVSEGMQYRFGERG
jgi:predicted GNAT family acetyltransferase